ncbi:RNA-binding protein [Candidatus Methylacidiphilum fumarolicum]|nr:RNA-binding protein [Candidatus Methylacidiphilum fumarolicum]TFE71041.1 RNA-binding protein [Methylacidiphilum sp. Yel]TFE77023.1 RNA-binding protein [Candidatus Methylacidiphilum fumarolicum]
MEELVTSNKLYVGNLPYNLTDSDLFEIFAKVGPIKNVEIIRDRRTNRTKGFGFVEMADLDSARKAVTILNRIEVMGRRIIVTGAKSEKKDSTQE